MAELNRCSRGEFCGLEDGMIFIVNTLELKSSNTFQIFPHYLLQTSMLFICKLLVSFSRKYGKETRGPE